MNITVYGKPLCVQCDATKRELGRRKLPFEEVDITQDAAALRKIKDMGYQQAPVVTTEDDSWSGFRPDKIKALDPTTRRGQVGLDSSPRHRIAL